MNQMTPCSNAAKPNDAFYSQFQNAAGYKPGDRIGNDCLCYGNIWSPNCCPKMRRGTNGNNNTHSNADGYANCSGCSGANGSFSNMVGPFGLGSGCGARPFGVGKKHKAKLDAWNTCMDQARAREAAKKQAKIDEKQAAAMANAALSTALGQSAPAPSDSSTSRGDGGSGDSPAGGLSMAAKIAIGVGAATVLVGGIFLIASMTGKSKKKKASK